MAHATNVNDVFKHYLQMLHASCIDRRSVVRCPQQQNWRNLQFHLQCEADCSSSLLSGQSFFKYFKPKKALNNLEVSGNYIQHFPFSSCTVKNYRNFLAV
eukprot:Pompholyxophrys_punicea_v1_NODE_863_length_1197_cov_1.908056.p2 type:complete len:100 gc:universal NODE_863_length_1197_cov_1.908056:372-671(+)